MFGLAQIVVEVKPNIFMAEVAGYWGSYRGVEITT